MCVLKLSDASGCTPHRRYESELQEHEARQTWLHVAVRARQGSVASLPAGGRYTSGGVRIMPAD
eukprot:COSAG05_NODE_528_length_8915_cov_26.504651_4_plen_64_part_00